MNPLRQLQQLHLTDEKYSEVIESIKDKDPNLPPVFRNFIVKDNRLIYEPLNLEYVPPKDQTKVLKSVYDGMESAGKGQNNWYRYITTRYLGITKRQAQKFLKSQEDYQLTRQPTFGRKKPLLANRPFQMFAIDLVDMNQYLTVRANRKYRYVMSVMDLFSGYTWFKPLKHKEPEDVLQAFETILGDSLNILPGRLVSDNGLEFKGVFEQFLKNNKISHTFTKTYSPEPHIEAVNNQLRKIMRQIFVRTNSLAWLPYLPEIQRAKNTQYNENHGATPDQIMTRFEADSHQDRKYLKNLTKLQTEKYKADMTNYKDNVLQVGDHVRIKLATRQTQIRQKIKAGNKKLVVVHWSPEVYRIQEVRLPKQGRIGYPKYVVENSEGNYITKEGTEYPQLFYRSELLQVTANQRSIISQKNANSLNRLNNPEDILVAGDQRTAEPVETVANPIPVARAEPIQKPVDKYTTADWNRELKGKEFTDEGERYMILAVEFKRGDNVNNYICDVVETKNYVNGKPTVKRSDRPYYILYAVLKEGKQHKEDWYVRDYDDAIIDLEARDRK